MKDSIGKLYIIIYKLYILEMEYNGNYIYKYYIKFI